MNTYLPLIVFASTLSSLLCGIGHLPPYVSHDAKGSNHSDQTPTGKEGIVGE